MNSPYWIDDSARALVHRSRPITNTLRISQRAFFTASDIRSGIVAHFPAAFDVLDATTTQLRVRRMLADVFAMVPAAHALGVCRGTDLHLQSADSSIGKIGRRRRERCQRCGRGNSDKTQFFTKTL